MTDTGHDPTPLTEPQQIPNEKDLGEDATLASGETARSEPHKGDGGEGPDTPPHPAPAPPGYPDIPELPGDRDVAGDVSEPGA
jgi:hypothetical protein